MANKPKAKVNDVFVHTESKKLFIVDSISNYPKGRLYTMKEVSPSSDVEYKRYYETRLLEKCTKTKTNKAVKVLYGKK